MEMDNSACEYFLSLADNVERIVKGDALAEVMTVKAYSVEDKAVPEPAAAMPASEPVIRHRSEPVSKRFSLRDSYLNCHSCPRWMNRDGIIHPAVGSMHPYILFLSRSMLPSGKFLTPAETDYFKSWIKPIGLTVSDVGLSAVIKCPGDAMDVPDGCLELLSQQVKLHQPKAIVFFTGAREAAGAQGDTFLGIPCFDLATPAEVLADPSLKRPVWETLKKAATVAGLADRIWQGRR